jgi:hypothetical protein
LTVLDRLADRAADRLQRDSSSGKRDEAADEAILEAIQGDEPDVRSPDSTRALGSSLGLAFAGEK